MVHHIVQFLAAIRDGLLHVADLLKDDATRRLADNAGLIGPAPTTLFATGVGRFRADAERVVSPPPEEIKDHLRLLRYATDPRFESGKYREQARKLFAYLLQSRAYLSAKEGAQAEQLKVCASAVNRESLNMVRQRVSATIRGRRRRRPLARRLTSH